MFLLLLIACGLRVDRAAAIEHGTPYEPASADIVLQRVPSTVDPRVRAFDDLRSRLARDPGNAKDAVKLADAYVSYSRATGDARYLGRALAVIEPWTQVASPPVPVLMVHATILQSRHLFGSSRDELGRILKRDRSNAQAWLTLATVEMVQADYSAANDACVNLARVGGDFLATLCTAQLRALTGHVAQAHALLSLIEHGGRVVPADIESYVQGLLADTARQLGDDDGAQAHYRKSLQLAPGDNFLLADYADFLLDQGRPQDVIALLEGYGQSDTSFLRIVLAETALNSANAHADADAMRARFASMDRRGSHVYERERSRFVLHVEHDPVLALTLAQRNWTVQRAPPDMRVLLEAALAANRPHAADPVRTLLAHSRLEDPAIDALVDKVSAAVDDERRHGDPASGTHP